MNWKCLSKNDSRSVPSWHLPIWGRDWLRKAGNCRRAACYCTSESRIFGAGSKTSGSIHFPVSGNLLALRVPLGDADEQCLLHLPESKPIHKTGIAHHKPRSLNLCRPLSLTLSRAPSTCFVVGHSHPDHVDSPRPSNHVSTIVSGASTNVQHEVDPSTCSTAPLVCGG